MILGIGIDTIEIERFALYHTFSQIKLLKLFSHIEIDYCINKKRPAVRFAGRFAAKEAFLKAYQSTLYHYEIQQHISLLKILKTAQVVTTAHGAPQLMIQWPQLLAIDAEHIEAHLSITNTAQLATAIVIISKK